MGPRFRRLVALLFAFLMSVNALGASIVQFSTGACCALPSNGGAMAAQSSTPCHESGPAAHACEHVGAGPSQSGDAGVPECDDQCATCVIYHASTPAFLCMAADDQTIVAATNEVPAFYQGAIPARRAERLDRPPAVPLN